MQGMPIIIPPMPLVKSAMLMSDVSGLAAALAGKANTSHTHIISDVTNLQTSLDAKATTTALTAGLATKANTSHTHTISDVTGLQTALDGKAAVSHTHTGSQITDFDSYTTSLGYKKTVNYTGLSVGFTLVTLLGVSYKDVTVTGVLATDTLVECVPTADLPANLTWQQARITANNTVRVCVASSILYTGNPTITFKVSVQR